MNADDPRARWHQIDSSDLRALTEETYVPGLLNPMSTNALPNQLQAMPGVVSYVASRYQTPVPLAKNLTAGAEMAVVRTDGAIAKAYNYIVATSSDGRVFFNGPHYNFPHHHFASNSPVPVESLFSHVPLAGKTKP